MSDDAAHLEQVVQQPEREVASPQRTQQEARGQFAGVEAVASAVGNRNFSQMIARMSQGEGIMADGLVHPDVQSAIDMSAGRGRPLEDHALRTLESGFGTSLGDVRIHDGPEAHALSNAVSARAFTVGRDIYFNKGEFNPRSREGMDLLAHEMAHAIQQDGAPRGGPLRVSNPGEHLENEADSAARAALG